MIKTVELEGADTRYKLYFLQRAYDKMRLYVELCEDEIGWLGYVDKLPDDAGYMVTDVFLLDQEVHGATTEISPTAIIDYYNSLDEEGRDNFLKRCKIWGHSHVNMAPTPSGQDDDMGKELSKDVEDFCYKLKDHKGIRSGNIAYAPFATYFSELLHSDKYPNVEKNFTEYTRKAFLYQRKKEPVSQFHRKRKDNSLPTLANKYELSARRSRGPRLRWP